MATTISRRDFLKLGGSATAGTALGGLAALGADLGPATVHAQQARIKDQRMFRSVCPYCAVGCGLIVHSREKPDGEREIINIEGDPESPINQGTLCPKGAATFQLHINPNRATKVLHRKPGATDWEEMDLNAAMDRVAQLTRETRDRTFVEKVGDKVVNHSLGIFSLGGATMDNEWNHIHQKLMRGLGVVAIENQARI